jgi:hypothetical protein
MHAHPKIFILKYQRVTLERKNEHALNFRDGNTCHLAETKQHMLANMEAVIHIEMDFRFEP